MKSLTPLKQPEKSVAVQAKKGARFNQVKLAPWAWAWATDACARKNPTLLCGCACGSKWFQQV
jgi:hypothetical protein